METWEVSLNVFTYRGGWQGNVTKFSFYTASLEAENTDEAKKELLFWARKKLSRFKPGKKRAVHIFGAPRIKSGLLSGDRMLRNRHSCETIYSINRRNANRILVEGYGPEAITELHRK